jgi:hypothetical protein
MGLGRKPGSSTGEVGAGGVGIVVYASDAVDPVGEYICDGTADQVEINAAIAALGGNSGRVQLSEGTFYLSAPITLNAFGVELRGSGSRYETTLTRTDATQHAIAVTSRSQIRDLYVYDDPTVTGTAKLLNVSANSLHMSRVGFETFEASTGCITMGAANIYADDCFFYAEDGPAILSTSNGTIEIRNALAFCGTSGYVFDYTGNGGTIQLTDSYFDGPGGVRIDGIGHPNVFIRACEIYAFSSAYAVLIDQASGIMMTDNQIGSNGGLDAVRVINITSPLSGVVISGNHIVESDRHGILLNNANDVMLTNNRVYGASRSSGDVYSGIILEANCDRCTVMGNQVRRASSTPHPKYGIRVDNSNCDNNFVTNNDLLNSVATGGTGAPYSDAGTGTVTTAGNRTV